MARAKKLPSGSWRCLVYDYTDQTGKRHYKSFTSDDPSPAGRREAEYLAADYVQNKPVTETVQDITLDTAITKYIDSKSGVLSPSTLRSYLSMQRNFFQDIGTISIRDLDNTTLQIWVSTISKNHTPKTVRNVHGLLSSALEMFLPDFKLKTTLPQRKRPELYVPSDEDIKLLLNHIKGTELEIAVLLAAFGPLRRGEICALDSEDINGNIISVSKSMVMGPGRVWSIKQPKTYSSYRTVEFPDFVIEKLTGIEGRIIKANPEQISNRFRRAVIYTGLPHFRFHDLRHYSASIMHAIGIPDQYIMARGGWATDNVMKTVYRNVIDMESTRQNKIILSHFSSMQHEMQHES